MDVEVDSLKGLGCLVEECHVQFVELLGGVLEDFE